MTMPLLPLTPLLAVLLAWTTTSKFCCADAASNGTGFAISAKLNFDATLPGNDVIMGMHLHTGSRTTNGPVNIISCGSAPLPTQNGPCIANGTVEGGRFVAVIDTPTSLGAWDLGVNDATAVANATTLAGGAPTTYTSFVLALRSCTADDCLVYFNIHTNYTFSINDGPFGLARAQLKPVTCPDTELNTTLCFGASGVISSNQTNLVDGLPTPLPDGAGEASPAWQGDVLVKWYDTSLSSAAPPSIAAFGSLLGFLCGCASVAWLLASSVVQSQKKADGARSAGEPGAPPPRPPASRLPSCPSVGDPLDDGLRPDRASSSEAGAGAPSTRPPPPPPVDETNDAKPSAPSGEDRMRVARRAPSGVLLLLLWGCAWVGVPLRGNDRRGRPGPVVAVAVAAADAAAAVNDDDEHDHDHDEESGSDAFAGDGRYSGLSLDGTDRHRPGELYQNPWGELCVDGQCYEASFTDEVLRTQGWQMETNWEALQSQHCRDLRTSPAAYCEDRRHLCTPDHPHMLTYCARTCRSCHREYEPADALDPHRYHRARHYVPPSKAVTFVKYARVYDASGSDLGVPQIVQPIPGRRLAALERRVQRARDYLRDEVQADDLYIPVRGSKCRNRHELCALWAVLGRCDRSGGNRTLGSGTAKWNLTHLTAGDDTAPTVHMNTSCAPVCFSCHELHPKSRCLIDYNQPHAWYPGDLRAMFERIVAATNESLPVTVLSRPPTAAAPEDRNDDSDVDEDDEDDGPPWILVLDKFLSPDQARALERVAAAASMEEAAAATGPEHAVRCEPNGCESSHEPVQQLLRRLEQLTGITRPHLDYVQFVRWAGEKEADTKSEAPVVPPRRHDYNASDKWSARGVPILTAWVVLNDLPGGSSGAVLEFPRLPQTPEGNATKVVERRAGRLVLWPNVLNGDPHEVDHATEYRVTPSVRRHGHNSNDPIWTVQVRMHQRHVRTARENGC